LSGSAAIQGSNFGPSSPYVVMDPARSATTPKNHHDATVLLRNYVGGASGRDLRRQLGARHPECSPEEIDDAVQAACRCFLDEAEGIGDPDQVHVWLRTAAHRILGHEARRQRREVATDPATDALEGIAVDHTGPVEELIALEDDSDLEALVRIVSVSLPQRKRDVFALYAAGCRRTQIAERLGLPERTVKRDIREIVDRARAVVTRLAGGGCHRGEPLVVRFVCGVSTPEESALAREHLARCSRCDAFYERLLAWRGKAGAMLPAPVAEGASPGVSERLAQKSAEAFSSLKQHVLDGAAQVKQHATTTYLRAADPMPFAAARPGTVAAVVAGCVAIGGGAATYCVQQGVNPLGAANGLVSSTDEPETPPSDAADEPQPPTYTPAEPAPSETPRQSEVAKAPEPLPEPKPEKASPVGDTYEPVHTDYMAASEEEPTATYEDPDEPAPVESSSPQPAAIPAGSGPQFGGPGGR
jgi:RNA polymerase sigma factor (sigma-70 family)